MNAGVILDGNDTRFLAIRLRRLFRRFGYTPPEDPTDTDETADANLVQIAGTCIGQLLMGSIVAESTDYKRGYEACVKHAVEHLEGVAADFDQMAAQAEANPKDAFAYMSNRARAKSFRERAELLRGQAKVILQLGEQHGNSKGSDRG